MFLLGSLRQLDMQECESNGPSTPTPPIFDVFNIKKTFLTKDFSSNIYPVTFIRN